MDTKRLKQFCVIVETGSMTKAARLLHMTHSGLSKSMRTLQEELGFSVLRPSGRGITVTENGNKIYQHAKEFLMLEEHLFFTKERLPQASLRIGTVEIFLLPLAEQFKHDSFQHHALTLLDLDPGQMEQLIVARQLDMALTYAPFPMEGVELVEIGQYALGCYHLEGYFTGQSLSDIPFVVPARGLSTNPLGIKERDGWLESLYPRYKKYSVNLLSTALQLTLQGLCAIYIPRFFAQQINARRMALPKLVEYVLPEPLQKNIQRAFILVHKSTPKDARFDQLCAMVRQMIA